MKYEIDKNPGPGAYERELLKSRKSVKIAEKTKDMAPLNVPGPGVAYFLYSPTNNSNMMTNHGW